MRINLLDHGCLDQVMISWVVPGRIRWSEGHEWPKVRLIVIRLQYGISP